MLDLEQEMSRCRVCPRKCGADREHGKTGYCKAPSGVAAARAAVPVTQTPSLEEILSADHAAREAVKSAFARRHS